jgi:hypothetical protein
MNFIYWDGLLTAEMEANNQSYAKQLGESAGIGFRLFAVWFLLMSTVALVGLISASSLMVSSLMVGVVGFVGNALFA